MQRTYRLSATLLAAALLGILPLTASAQGTPPPRLDIGDPAPALRPLNWLKGSPVAKLEKGQVYVVEFWATWCGPCRAAFPKLSALSRKYKNRVTFIGLDSVEGTERAKVEAFVKKQGATMDYRVALDMPNGRSGADWMYAAGEAGIPVAFVVDKAGRVAWIGHSPEELDKVLPGIVAGTYSLSAERARRAANRDPHDAVTLALGEGDFPRAVALIDAEIAKHPGAAGSFTLDLYRALSHYDVPRFRRSVRADLERTNGDPGIYHAATLSLVLADGLPKEAYRFGLELVEEAVKASDQKLMLLSRGAEIAMRVGDPAKAVDLQVRAIAAAENTPTCTAERREELRKELEQYRAAAARKGA